MNSIAQKRRKGIKRIASLIFYTKCGRCLIIKSIEKYPLSGIGFQKTM